MTTYGCDDKFRSSNPYEIQMLNVTAIANGVSLKLTVTTDTRVYNVFVSMIAWDINAQNTVGNSF